VLNKLKKNIFIWLGITALFYLAFAIYGDFDSLIKTLETFNFYDIIPLLILSFANYFFRFIKWHYYLRLLEINISIPDSFAIFMSGLIMTITPGKMGELLKAFLVKDKTGTPVSRTLPVILSERITDFLAIIFLALVGAFLFGLEKGLLIFTAVFFILIIFVISSEKLSLKIIALISKIKVVNKYSQHLLEAYKSSVTLLKIKPLSAMLIVSIAAWFFECFGFYLILTNFETDISVFWATFVYAFATIVGSLSMLPAGLGVTDGSLTYFIIKKGLSKHIAVAATFLIRSVTLWFAVLVGGISVLIFKNMKE